MRSSLVNGTPPGTRLIAAAALAVALVLGAAAQAQAQSGALKFEHLGIEDGLSESVVTAIAQDQYGFMWFGTRNGLDKYDGYSFTPYTSDDADPASLSDSFVTTLYVDRQGTLWVGTFDGGLNRLERPSGTFVQYRHDPASPQSLSHDRVRSIFEDSDGQLWVGTEGGGLNRLDRETGAFTRLQASPNDPHGLTDNTVRAIREDSTGHIWVGTNRGLNRLDLGTGQFAHFQHQPSDPDSIASDLITSLESDASGALWVGTWGGGLDRFDASTETFAHFRHDPRDPRSISDNTVSSIHRDAEGILWIGTGSGGLNRFDPAAGTFERFVHNELLPESLSDNNVRAIFEDRSGVLWVGTFGGGLNKFGWASETFVHYQRQPDVQNTLSSKFVTSLWVDRNGTVWLGTRGGGLNSLDRSTGTYTQFIHDPSAPATLSSNTVWAITEDTSGRLWVGTQRGGLNLMDRDGGTFETYVHSAADPQSLADNSVRALLEDTTETLWVGTYAGLDRFDPDTDGFIHYRHDPADLTSLSHNIVLSLYEDSSGTLWVGTDGGGLNKFDRETGTFTSYSHVLDDPSTLSNNSVLSIAEDELAALWIGTGGGLNRFSPATGRFTQLSEQDGLPNDTIYGILPDETGNLWLSTDNGLSRLHLPTMSFQNFDAGDGLQSNGFLAGAYHRTAQGEMLFGGVNGFNAFFPERVRDNPHVPPIVITDFKVFNETIRREIVADEQMELSYRDNFFSFEFAALDFTDPSQNQYAYKLEGLHTDWITAETRRYASFSNLAGGDYTLRVKGSNNDGVWNDKGISVGIRITPPFWRTWWFTALAAAAVISGSFGSYRLRVRTIEARRRKLEQEVAQATAEIQRRRQVAEGLRDILAILNANEPLDHILGYVVSHACQLLRADASTVHRYDLTTGTVTIEARCGAPEQWNEVTSFRLHTSAAHQRILNRQTYAVADLTALPGDAQPRAGLGSAAEPSWYSMAIGRFRGFLAIPLVIEDEVYGSLAFYYVEPRSFTDEEISLASAYADQVALVMETASLRAQAEQTAVVAERNRLARDLHDAVTQTLFSATLIADVLPRLWERNPDEGQRRIAELRELTRGALAEMRTLLLELRPSALADASLVDLLHQLADSITGRARVPVRVTDEGVCEITPEVKVALYRIAQEALNNIAKHAQASQATLRLQCGAEGIQMEVSDNGRGFDPASVPPQHLGLGIMRERAEAIGATVDITSAIGQGTTITLRWSAEREGSTAAENAP